MNNPVRHLKITYVILFLLIAMSMIVPFTDLAYGLLRGSDTGISSFVEWFGERIVGPWVYPTFINWSPVLIAIAILLNRENLQNMNVDKPFVVLFVYAALIIAWSFFLPVGWLAGIASFGVLISLLAGTLTFGNIDHRNSYTLSAWMIVGFLVLICVTSGNISIENTTQALKELGSYIFSVVVYEEIIYRGLLWMFLRNRNWREPTIVLFQAFLFWISHINMILTDFVWFLTIVPAVSLLLGYIVLRTRSLTASTIAHVMCNFLIRLFS